MRGDISKDNKMVKWIWRNKFGKEVKVKIEKQINNGFMAPE